MKAVMLQAPDLVAIRDVPEPTPSSDEVLLRVRMVGLCGSDLSSYRGKNPMVTYPRIPGHEVAATIVKSASGWSNLQPGMDVTLSPYTSCNQCAACQNQRPNACLSNQTLGVQRDGALTEFITVAPEKVYPANLSIKELCLVEPLTVGFHAVARGRVSSQDTVAVFGCGGVGLGAIAASGFCGARTIAIDVDEEKLSIARQSGATDTIHTKRESLHERLLECTGGRGPDVVIEAIGLPDTFRAAVEEVAFTGRVVYIGYAKEPVSYETHLFVKKELDIMGSRNALPTDFFRVISMLEAKRFPVDQAVSSILRFHDTPEILQQWDKSPGRFTKIMVQVS